MLKFNIMETEISDEEALQVQDIAFIKKERKNKREEIKKLEVLPSQVCLGNFKRKLYNNFKRIINMKKFLYEEINKKPTNCDQVKVRLRQTIYAKKLKIVTDLTLRYYNFMQKYYAYVTSSNLTEALKRINLQHKPYTVKEMVKFRTAVSKDQSKFFKDLINYLNRTVIREFNNQYFEIIFEMTRMDKKSLIKLIKRKNTNQGKIYEKEKKSSKNNVKHHS